MKIATTFKLSDQQRRAIAAHLMLELQLVPDNCHGQTMFEYDGKVMVSYRECKNFLKNEGLLGVERVVGEFSDKIGKDET